MGVAREGRPSEKVFGEIWSEIRSLNNCVWHGVGLLENTEEHVHNIKRQLDLMLDLMRNGE